jgi:hypothetical protein
MSLLLWTDEDRAALVAAVETYSTATESIAEAVADIQHELHRCKLRLDRLPEHDACFRMDLERLDEAISRLENDPTDVRMARAALLGWQDLTLTNWDLPPTSLASLGEVRGPEGLLGSLLTPAELAELRRHLGRPLFDRLCWTKADYLVCGACVMMGLALELLNVAWRTASPIDRDGVLRRWFDHRVHVHPPDSPIDYQGPGFGGDLHRVRSRGHDLARFLEAIDQTATGEFRGTRWTYSTPREAISGLNQFGRPYPEMDWTAAFVNVVVHLFGDFFSSHSLPLPLSSVVYDHAGREFRIFIHQLYANGFSLRHVAIGSAEVILAFLAIEAWLWLQHGSDGRETDCVMLKRYEMRSAVTGILSGANVAGCVLFENPFLMNLPLLIASIDSSGRLLRLRADRESEILKASRNLQNIAEDWDTLAGAIRDT